MTSLPGEIVLTRRGLYMLPSRQGWMFAATVVVVLLAAINYGNSLAYGLAFLLAALAVVSMLATDRNLLHLRLRTGACTPVFAGEVAVFRVHLVNDGARPRYGVALMQNRREVARTDVAAGAIASVELHLPAERRGWLTPAPVYVTTGFPFGIFYSWSRQFALDARGLVYPSPSEPWPWRAHSDMSAAAELQAIASGDDFSGVREYRPGDSPRQIDWKSAARGRGLLTKEFASGLGATIWLDLARVPAPDLETRLSMLCRAVLEAEQSGQHYGLRLGATVLAPASGEAHQQQCLRRLALYGSA